MTTTGVGIQIISGETFFIDEEDFEEVSKYKWHGNKGNGGIYIVRAVIVSRSPQRQQLIRLHNQLMNYQVNKVTQVDHIDGDSLNNRRSNLEIVTIPENNRRRSLRRYGIRTDPFGNELPQGISYNTRLGNYLVRYERKYVGSSTSLEYAKILLYKTSGITAHKG